MNKTQTTQASDLSALTELGRGKTSPSKKLETFPNRNPERPYLVELYTDEFTCLCPATGQPDFAKLYIRYVPRKKIVESKSLKLYLWSFRNTGCFHEHLANLILSDLTAALNPVWCQVEGFFNVRGGIAIRKKKKKGKKPKDI